MRLANRAYLKVHNFFRYASLTLLVKINISTLNGRHLYLHYVSCKMVTLKPFVSCIKGRGSPPWAILLFSMVLTLPAPPTRQPLVSIRTLYIRPYISYLLDAVHPQFIRRDINIERGYENMTRNREENN